jgi:TPR repeat protein
MIFFLPEITSNIAKEDNMESEQKTKSNLSSGLNEVSDKYFKNLINSEHTPTEIKFSEDGSETINLDQLFQMANNGDFNAQYRLGTEFIDGNCLKKNPEIAAKWIKKAADQGHSEAQMRYGFYCLDWVPRETETEENIGVEYLKKAAKQGNVKASKELSYLYLEGSHVEFCPDEAVQWTIHTVESGGIEENHHLGQFYEFGEGVKEDRAKAFSCTEIAAKAGSLLAMTRLCAYYLKGVGTQPDFTKAMEWILKAAQLNHSYAQLVLACFKKLGIGSMKKNEQEAIYWMQKAADNDHPTAKLFNLTFWLKSKKSLRTKKKAIIWLQNEKDNGNSIASDALNLLESGDIFWSDIATGKLLASECSNILNKEVFFMSPKKPLEF